MGANAKRPELAKRLKALKDGDVLTVWKLDRLGRPLRDLIALLDDLKAQGVTFQSLTEAIGTETPTGRAAACRHCRVAQPTHPPQNPRAVAMAHGVRMGRKRLLSAQQVAHARTLLEQGEGPDNVPQSLNVSRRTLYRALSGTTPSKQKSQ